MAALRQSFGEQSNIASPTFNKKSFSELFDNTVTSKPALKVNAKVSSHRGEPTILFAQADLEMLATLYKFVLVGKFSKGRPKIEDLRKFFHSLYLKEEASLD